MKKIKENFVLLFQMPYFPLIMKIFFFFILGYLVIGLWKGRNLPPQIPLFYSLPRGPQQLGTPLMLFLLPFFSFVFFFGNLFFASFLFPKEKLAAFLLAIGGLIIVLIFFLAYLKIIFLVS